MRSRRLPDLEADSIYAFNQTLRKQVLRTRHHTGLGGRGHRRGGFELCLVDECLLKCQLSVAFGEGLWERAGVRRKAAKQVWYDKLGTFNYKIVPWMPSRVLNAGSSPLLLLVSIFPHSPSPSLHSCLPLFMSPPTPVSLFLLVVSPC